MLDQYSVCGLCGTHHIGTPCPPRFTPRPYTEAVPKTVYVTYPYPPLVLLPDGTYYAMPTPYELAQMVILMRQELDAAKKRISEMGEKE